jgi:hypothetical protein
MNPTSQQLKKKDEANMFGSSLKSLITQIIKFGPI